MKDEDKVLREPVSQVIFPDCIAMPHHDLNITRPEILRGHWDQGFNKHGIARNVFIIELNEAAIPRLRKNRLIHLHACNVGLVHVYLPLRDTPVVTFNTLFSIEERNGRFRFALSGNVAASAPPPSESQARRCAEANRKAREYIGAARDAVSGSQDASRTKATPTNHGTLLSRTRTAKHNRDTSETDAANHAAASFITMSGDGCSDSGGCD